MRLFTAAVVMLAMVASAHAQGGFNMSPSKGGARSTPEQDRQASERKKSDDKAYKSALEKIQPSQEQKPDPWKNMR